MTTLNKHQISLMIRVFMVLICLIWAERQWLGFVMAFLFILDEIMIRHHQLLKVKHKDTKAQRD